MLMSKPLFAAATLAALLATTAHATEGRLPGGVVPLAYTISVNPDAAKLTFTGKEMIRIKVAAPTRTITLNAAELTIASVRLDAKTAGTVSLDADAQTATFTFAAPVAAGEHALSIVYGGKISQSASGMFAIDYNNTDGSKARMIVTQFEASDARRFAPTWDEPGFKTPFTLSTTVPKGQTAFSNMPVASKVGDVTTFATTPKMSAYLMFLGIGDVERKTLMAGKSEIGVITRRGVVDQGDYALASAKRILAAYNDYFGVPYPLPKLDMIAGPGSSAFFGAMENWGAIFYFEQVLLVDPKLITENRRQDIFNVVAHEMAHQWFGDLVTMAWWDDLWLNEGFASWTASKISNDLNPEWGALSQSVAFPRQQAMALDARAVTHPIVQHVTTPDQINQAFDNITYLKGEAVIRMLEGAVGPDTFRAGVRRYMAKYKYSNTVTDQLWEEIGAAAKQPVAPLMHSFTLQGGVPLIRVGEPVCTGGNTTLTLAQGRFALDEASKASRTWIVPVNVAGTGAIKRVDVSGPAPVAATVPGCGPVVVNAGQSGYYRTLYTPAHFAALAGSITKLSEVDQIGLTADAYGLANSGDATIERYLALVGGLNSDASPLLWSMVSGQFAGIDRMLQGAPEQTAFRIKARSLLRPVFDRVGWTGRADEISAMKQLREDIIPVLGLFGDPAVSADAARYAEASFTDPASVPGPIRQPALQVFSYNATPAQWDALHARAMAEKSPVAKQQLYRNLGAVHDEALANRALAIALTDEVAVPTRATIIQAVASQHPAMAFDWATAHQDAVNGMLESSTRSGFVVGLAAGSGDAAVADRVMAFAVKTFPETSRKPAETAAAVIRYRAALRQRQAAAIGKWSM